MIKTLVAAALLTVTFAAPSHAFFLPGAMFSGSYDYISQAKNNTVRTVAIDPDSIHAVKNRIFSIGNPNLGD